MFRTDPREALGFVIEPSCNHSPPHCRIALLGISQPIDGHFPSCRRFSIQRAGVHGPVHAAPFRTSAALARSLAFSRSSAQSSHAHTISPSSRLVGRRGPVVQCAHCSHCRSYGFGLMTQPPFLGLPLCLIQAMFEAHRRATMCPCGAVDTETPPELPRSTEAPVGWPAHRRRARRHQPAMPSNSFSGTAASA